MSPDKKTPQSECSDTRFHKRAWEVEAKKPFSHIELKVILDGYQSAGCAQPRSFVPTSFSAELSRETHLWCSTRLRLLISGGEVWGGASPVDSHILGAAEISKGALLRVYRESLPTPLRRFPQLSLHAGLRYSDPP